MKFDEENDFTIELFKELDSFCSKYNSKSEETFAIRTNFDSSIYFLAYLIGNKQSNHDTNQPKQDESIEETSV